MNTYFCTNCNHTFKHKGQKKEFKHPIYGPSWKRVAPCPKCKSESQEQTQTKTRRGDSSSSSSPSCATGSCPFVN